MERVLVPPRLRVWSEGEWHIYFDPYNFIWVRVNDSGRLLIELFRKHMTIPAAAEYVSKKFGLALDKAEEAVRRFVDSVAGSGFLHLNRYYERPRTEFLSLEFPHD